MNANDLNNRDQQQTVYINTGNDNSGFDLSIFPVKTDKTPMGKWKHFQSQIAPISEWKNHYNNEGYVGIITGTISGNLEIVDIDVKNDPKKSVWEDYRNLIPQELYAKLLVQSTPNDGYHLIYRCPEAVIEPNQALAKTEDKKVIIETRGEGGYFCHHLQDYKVQQGVFNLQEYHCEIPVISPEERELLLSTARSLDRLSVSKNKEVLTNYKEPAINEFNDKYNIIELFTKHGWEIHSDDVDQVRLKRPGSDNPYSGYYFKDSKVFMCYSTSTPFKVKQPYNHFQALQVLEGKGDYKTTLRILQLYGYELSGTSNKITADDIAKHLNDNGVRYDSFRQDLIYKGEVISERVYNTIFLDMKKHFKQEIARSRFEDVIKSLYITQHHPILEFIEKYKDRKPQGMFEKWVDCMIFKKDDLDKSIVLYFFKKWYVGMIAQSLGGKHPNEFFLTLLSTEQGIGKTFLLRNRTLPEELHDYIAEHSLTFDDDFKVIMGQYILIIDDEMDGRTYDMEKTFKHILSNKVLTTRRKYDRRISNIDRRCSFAGSGNNLNVVREPQNRRVIPIELAGVNREKLNSLDLVDLFMEAYNLYADGFAYNFDIEKDKALLKHLDQDYIQMADIDLLLNDLVTKPINENDIYYLATIDIATVLSTKYPMFSKRINVPAIGKKMVELGFKSIRKGHNKTSCFEVSSTSMIRTMMNGYMHSDVLNKNN